MTSAMGLPNRDVAGTTIRTVAASLSACLLVACSSAVTASPVASVASPVASVAATPIATAAAPIAHGKLAATFTSPLMGYSVRYPVGWVVAPATVPWTPDQANFWDDPVGDRLEAGGAGFRGTSQPLAPGETSAEWLQRYLGGGPAPACSRQSPVLVGNVEGTLSLEGCQGLGRLGGAVLDVAVVSGGRGYNFTMEGAVDRPFLEEMLATVAFAP